MLENQDPAEPGGASPVGLFKEDSSCVQLLPAWDPKSMKMDPLFLSLKHGWNLKASD